MTASTPQASSTPPIDKDLAEQAHRGHGVPSQDPDPEAQFPLEPEDAKRETNSVLVSGGLMAGSATGAAMGVVAAGPVGVVVGATLGAIVGALGGAAAGAAVSPNDLSLADMAPEPSSEARTPLQKRLHLKTFVLKPNMLTLSGTFYPKGYVVVMFPDVQQAEQAAQELVSSGFDGEAIMLLPPETILGEIACVDSYSDIGLPSVGTEGATAQKYIELAREGHFGLMVHAESDKETADVMEVVRALPFSYAQKYHMLAMQNLE
jgi:hypothetical protein